MWNTGFCTVWSQHQEISPVRASWQDPVQEIFQAIVAIDLFPASLD